MAFVSGIAVRHLTTSASRLAIKNVTVIGGGLMGSGIAQVAAQTGHNVTMVDMSDDILQKSRSSVEKSLSRVVKKKYADDAAAGEKFLSETMSRFSTNTDALEAAASSDLVIEAIVENIGIKRKLFKSLDEVAPKCAASSSSTPSSSSGHYLSMAKLTAVHRQRALLHRYWAGGVASTSVQQARTFSSSQHTGDKDGNNSSSSSSDSDSSDSDSDAEKPRSKPAGKASKEAQVKDIGDDSISKSSDSSDKVIPEAQKDTKNTGESKTKKKELNLAKPGKLKKELREKRIKDQEVKRDLEHDRQQELEPGMTTAIKGVAKQIGDGTTSDLLSKLKEQQKLADDQSQSKGGMDLNDLFGGITVTKKAPGGEGRGERRRFAGERGSGDQERRPRGAGGLRRDASDVDDQGREQRPSRDGGGSMERRRGPPRGGESADEWRRGPARRGSEDEQGLSDARPPRDDGSFERRRPVEKLPKIFGEERLGIFNNAPAEKKSESEEITPIPTKSLFDVIQKEELEKYSQLPPSNSFEEQIDWMKKGVVWKFPVDNEVGMEHEQNVGFHEHVFLEHLLEDGFPKSGPIRHFMELVCVGLSKNAYLTVEQKHAHIHWFRDYFESKKKIMDEMMVTEDTAANLAQPKQLEQ